MLTIRAAQMNALSAAKQEDFVRRGVAYAREAMAKKVEDLDDEQLADTVRAACAKAGSYGFVSELDHIRFLNFMFSLGPDFDTDPRWPWIREILGDQKQEPSDRMAAFMERVAEEAKNEKESS
jgi:hypothetical protein